MTQIIEWIEAEHSLAGIFSFLILIALSFIPAFPMPVIIGTIAISFDFWTALFISWGGTVVGASIMFFFSRFFLQGYVEKKQDKWQRFSGFLTFMKKNEFLAILIARIIPILPSAAINFISGVSKISFRAFFLATAIGKFPSILAYTIAGQHASNNNWTAFFWALLYSLTAFLIGMKIRNKFKVES